jgi:hypothetical protein
VSTLIKSLVVVVLLGAGLVVGRATARNPSTPIGSADACCAEGCTATIECTDGGCIVHWKAPDGRTGDIEVSCVGGECKLIRCDPCCADGSGASAAKPAAAGSGCCK